MDRRHTSRIKSYPTNHIKIYTYPYTQMYTRMYRGLYDPRNDIRPEREMEKGWRERQREGVKCGEENGKGSRSPLGWHLACCGVYPTTNTSRLLCFQPLSVGRGSLFSITLTGLFSQFLPKRLCIRFISTSGFSYLSSLSFFLSLSRVFSRSFLPLLPLLTPTNCRGRYVHFSTIKLSHLYHTC